MQNTPEKLIKEELLEDLAVYSDAFVLERLAGSRDLSEEKTQRRMEILGIRLHAPQYVVVTYAPYLMSKEAECIDKTLLNMVNFIKEGYARAKLENYVVTDSYCNVMAVISIFAANDLKRVDEVTEKLTANIIKKCEIDMYVGIGQPVDRFSEIHKSKQTTKEALAYKFTFAHNNVVRARDVERIYNQSTIKFSEYIDRILGCFYDGNIPLLSVRLDELTAVIESSMEDPLSSMKNICIELTASISQRTREIGLNMFNDRADVYEGILNLSSLEELCIWFVEMCTSAIKGIAELRVDKNTQILNMAVAYITDNLGNENLSLQTISDHISLSTSYFSELFYQHTNSHVIEYINKKRIEKAKELLTKTNLKAAEIGRQVGFASANYFNNVFKKNVGLPPQKYRQQFMKDT